ncbi:sulfotransferase domain-containing protein [Peribacillus frigoritolerans]|uniref:sulfotransferase domain-containing protein n=1 Tax=Peribacillus frigoritolerans TaxID=450367 RepID=UPI00119913C1|nr:sulfotransferase domain-containing protein [Peribacillus frigoritolerans]TWE00624.1 sulfotransferase domain-containing protein [Peribacillus frigoritolerans]
MLSKKPTTVLDDDMFIVSYPRSGNTWVRFLIGTLYFNLKIDWKNIEEYVQDIYHHDDSQLLKFKSPRLLKSHSSYDKRYNKVIYIVRDVRDVVISYYYWHLKMSNYQNTFDEFFYEFIAGKCPFQDWDKNVTSWIKNKNKVENGFLLLRYEDLKHNTFEQLKNIADFLSIQRDGAELNSAITWASFENMRRLETEQQSEVKRFKNSDHYIPFIRQGKSGNWQNILSDIQKQIIKERFGDLLYELGYEI